MSYLTIACFQKLEYTQVGQKGEYIPSVDLVVKWQRN